MITGACISAIGLLIGFVLGKNNKKPAVEENPRGFCECTHRAVTHTDNGKGSCVAAVKDSKGNFTMTCACQYFSSKDLPSSEVDKLLQGLDKL